jgi:hypothetical protein
VFFYLFVFFCREKDITLPQPIEDDSARQHSEWKQIRSEIYRLSVKGKWEFTPYLAPHEQKAEDA